jgi:hypothetical protein
MIPSTGNYQIVSTDPIGVYHVEAWGDDGAPMIGSKTGLVYARAVLNAWQCEPIDPPLPILAVPAAPGWVVEFMHVFDPEATWTEPIVAWTINREREIDPVIVDDTEEGARLLSVSTANSPVDLEWTIKWVGG